MKTWEKNPSSDSSERESWKASISSKILQLSSSLSCLFADAFSFFSSSFLPHAYLLQGVL